MKICEPKKMSEKDDWFTHDTSTLNFSALKAEEIVCGEYYEKGIPAPISGIEEEQFNRYQFGNQVFAWEKILVFKISDWSSHNERPEMYVVLPVKYKSFQTSVRISSVSFLSGKVVFLDETDVVKEGAKIIITSSLKKAKGVNYQDFLLKEIL